MDMIYAVRDLCLSGPLYPAFNASCIGVMQNEVRNLALLQANHVRSIVRGDDSRPVFVVECSQVGLVWLIHVYCAPTVASTWRTP
eukprot:6477639-Amphidinium_carterae.3